MGNTPKIFRFYIMFIHFPMMFQIKIAISSIFDQYPPLHQNKPWKIAKKLRYHEVPSVESTPPTPNPWQGQRAVEVNNLEPEIQHTSPGHGFKGQIWRKPSRVSRPHQYKVYGWGENWPWITCGVPRKDPENCSCFGYSAYIPSLGGKSCWVIPKQFGDFPGLY